MKIQVVLSCIILILFSFWSCRRDSDITIIEEFATISVNGFVSNEENLAVKKAEVIINGSTIFTDNFGYFNAENINHDGKIVIQVKGSGYFDGSRTLFTRSKEKIFTQIQLIKENYQLQFMGRNNDEHLRTALFNQSKFKNFVPEEAVKFFYDKFKTENPVWYYHPVSTLLTLSKFSEHFQ